MPIFETRMQKDGKHLTIIYLCTCSDHMPYSRKNIFRSQSVTKCVTPIVLNASHHLGDTVLRIITRLSSEISQLQLTLHG